MTALTKIQDAGFNLSLLENGNVEVYPFSKLTDEQRDFIITNKPAIIHELKLEKAYLYWHVVTPTNDVYLSVVPKITLAKIKAKFPKAIIVEPVDTMQ